MDRKQHTSLPSIKWHHKACSQKQEYTYIQIVSLRKEGFSNFKYDSTFTEGVYGGIHRETNNCTERTAPLQASDRTLLMTTDKRNDSRLKRKGFFLRGAFRILKFFGWRGDVIVQRPRKWRNNSGLLSR